MRSWIVRFAFAITAAIAHGAVAAEGGGFCADCQLQIGVGGTYHYWGSTGGIVLPVTLVWDQDRYELGAFRMATAQEFYDETFQARIRVANPYWGFSASRRWEWFRHRYWRVVVGLGGAYRSEEDRLSASHWDFAEQLGLRITPSSHTAIELCLRHWSNAGLRLPNRGQDFATVTFVITPPRLGR